ncbi:cell cycle protein [Gemella morbillorum M424]|uniref:Probable peptidoglycan glycosyltransferase FtsW n=1 Tax=Gemella morbillorum TaxID=29391 RepID=A0AAP9KTQ3_9BACL|nr:FtsW/RodA/SpoVE family cell cycle protein [Gemella morbillorum]EFV35767.1 cell cycle protein [Gemella morbillorum M424]QGS09671.1 FtsW/RodA/SpoVE family cell cycle protein [Gemella morbillorum]
MIREIRKSIKHERRHVRVDWMVALTLLILLIFSCIMVYSASMIGNKYGTFTSSVPVEASYFLKRQAAWAVLSYVAFLFFSVAIPHEFFKNKKLLQHGFWGMLILLVIPLLLPAINGARSWIRLGALSFQPSTLAQLFIIIYMAFILETRKVKLRQLCTSSELFSIFSIPLALIAVIALQNDTGMILITLSVIGIMTLCSNIHFKNIKKILTLAIIGVAFLIMYALTKASFSNGTSYRTNRLKVFLNPFSENLSAAADQVINSYIAFGNGGLVGRGLGNSIQKLGYLPEAHTDFILAIIAEELGLIGVLFVIALLGLLIGKVIFAGTKSKNTFSAMYALGFASLLIVQAVVNIGGVTASIPMTGVPLPFISNGGSSLLILSVGLGIATNVLSHVKYLREQK